MILSNYNRGPVEYTVDENALTITATGKRPNGRAFGGLESFTVTEDFRTVLMEAPFNMDENAAEFIAEWYPETIHTAADKCKYFPYDWETFAQMTENELSKLLDYSDVTEDEYENKYGFIIRDAAFSGVIVIGE